MRSLFKCVLCAAVCLIAAYGGHDLSRAADCVVGSVYCDTGGTCSGVVQKGCVFNSGGKGAFCAFINDDKSTCNHPGGGPITHCTGSKGGIFCEGDVKQCDGACPP
jgi:hypothetical protein